MTAHVPYVVKLRGGLEKFSGESLEKKNDDVKKTHMRKTDHRSPKQTLQTQLRIEYQEADAKLEAHLAGENKRKRSFPGRAEEVRERMKRRKELEEEERVAATAALQSPYANLSAKELREIIYLKTGKKTQKQKVQYLLDILHQIDSARGAAI